MYENDAKYHVPKYVSILMRRNVSVSSLREHVSLRETTRCRAVLPPLWGEVATVWRYACLLKQQAVLGRDSRAARRRMQKMFFSKGELFPQRGKRMGKFFSPPQQARWINSSPPPRQARWI
jgi:hypothetical protein